MLKVRRIVSVFNFLAKRKKVNCYMISITWSSSNIFYLFYIFYCENKVIKTHD